MISIISKPGISVRLPDERWAHIAEEHGELAEMKDQVLATVSGPERILEGNGGEMLTVKSIELGKFLVVVYRKLSADGFIITAFLTRRASLLNRRKQLWP